jgi:hypothetical protein
VRIAGHVVTSELEREFREFLAAKKRKGEPVIRKAHGAGSASYRPSSPRGFANFRAALRGVGDWGQASERVDALEHSLRARHAVALPLPRKVIQNEDRSLTLFWQGVTARFLVDGVSVLAGGVAGVPSIGVTTELLDMLGFLARIQSAA